MEAAHFIFIGFILCYSPTFSSQSTYSQITPHNPQIFSAAEPLRRAANRLGKPFIGDDGRVYACAEKNVYAFESNGTIAWTVHLNFTCNIGIAPVYGGKRKVYVVAENRVLRINSLNIGTSDPVIEVFSGQEEGEIIGLSASTLTSSVYVNVKHQGLFSYTLRGQLAWSVGPSVDRFGYRQGCKKKVEECYFTSAPVIDQCDANIYTLGSSTSCHQAQILLSLFLISQISNNEGELYSLSVRSPRYKWIQDFSFYGNICTITSGNNGRLYVTVPDKAMVFALDVSTGDILWQRSIGPLRSTEYVPVVDSNGWISIGSLDGFLYSVSPEGNLKKFSKASSSDSVIQVSPVIDCSGYAVYIAQTEMEGKNGYLASDYTYVSAMKPKNVIFTLLVPATGSVYWSESYPGQFSAILSGSDLRNFVLDEGILLGFVTASRIGNPLPCQSTRQRLAASCSEVRIKNVSVYTGNEGAILRFLLFESVILLVLAIVVQYCCIFWGKRKLQNRGLGEFLEKRRSLWLKKKEFDRTITELEQKASEEATTSDVIEKLSDVLREREGIERKLCTTYSLGRDHRNLLSKSLLPLYDEKTKTKSKSLQGSKKESVTIFHTFSDTSSGESSPETASRKRLNEENLNSPAKAKTPFQVESYSDEDDHMNDVHYDSSTSESRSRGFVDSLFGENESSEPRKMKTDDELDKMKIMQSGRIRSSIRRRTLSSTI
ncbi:hypothetical protein Nepgr_022524 [Nepenthes gracilis]|uniref:Protein GAMETE EXPRESSED 3 n=1 Tax=Nepenthes gracilis TaxID=150966 RepID=A0AAD3XX35_NEPGR|nr:hypothetical protein Nepgr_022524 [Nepenthes gracilis]